MSRRVLLFIAILASSPAFGKAGAKEGHVALGVAVPDFTYDVDTAAGSDAPPSTITYAPNIPLALTVEVALYGITIGTSFDLPDFAGNEEPPALDDKAKTTFESYSLSYFFDRVGIDLSYVRLKGMNLVSATGQNDADLAKDQDTHRPDIELKSQSANLWLEPLAYNLALCDFLDPASHASGSGIGLIVIGAYDNLDEKTKKRLIPPVYSAPYGADATFMGGNFRSFSVLAGPAAVLDYHGFYISGLFAYGPGRQEVTYRSSDEGSRTENSRSDKLELYVAGGYKGDRIFSSVNYAMETPSYELHTINLSTTRAELNILAGIRF